MAQGISGSAEAAPAEGVDVAEMADMDDINDELVAGTIVAPAPLDETDAPDPQPLEDLSALESDAADEISDAAAEATDPGESSDAVDAQPSQEVAWDDFDDPDFIPADAPSLAGSEAQGQVDRAEASPVEIEGSTLVVGGVTLGPIGVDAEGHVGRVHTVKPGDTLWDVSNAYLGTAWVWPSVWKENREIENPHRIEPGDRLWISSTEIRAISEEEADVYLAGAEILGEPVSEQVAAELPDAFEPEMIEEFPAADDEFAQAAALDEFGGDELDQLPVGMPDDGAPGNETGRVVRVAMRENMSFVSDVQLQASTSILDSPSDRLHLSMLDTIYFGLGEAEVEVGDEFTLFRNITDVRSPTTRELLGYYVDVLGWAEVIEVTGESCVAVIRVSIAAAMKGDRAMPRYQMPTDIRVKYPQENIEGEIAFLPASRTLMGTTDYVFVDVGATQGVEIGTDLEVYDPGQPELDTTRDQRVRTPDRVIADLIVVTVQEESSVAFIAHTRRELAIGDSIRGATRDFPGAF
jgi:hypothetical protein